MRQSNRARTFFLLCLPRGAGRRFFRDQLQDDATWKDIGRLLGKSEDRPKRHYGFALKAISDLSVRSNSRRCHPAILIHFGGKRPTMFSVLVPYGTARLRLGDIHGSRLK